MRLPFHFTALIAGALITLSGIKEVHAQGTVEYINANMINAGQGIGGNLFTRLDTLATFRNDVPVTGTNDLYDLYEVPQGTNKRDVFTAGIWMNGTDTAGIVHCAAQTYNDNGPDYYDGPIAALYDSLYLNYYGRVFRVSKAQIDFDQTLSFPVASNLIDSAILLWPGAGNPFVLSAFGVNIASGLAPFVDVDHDGIYNPMNGDYPAICGDAAIFFVFNDMRGPHHETGTTEKLGVEVRGMAYEYSDTTSLQFAYPKRAINNTVFVQYDIENKSSLGYDSFYLTLFEDPDIGCALNDMAGCDTVRKMMLAYNGSTPDPDCLGETSYAPYQVAHGVIMLNQKMENFSFLYEHSNTSCAYYYGLTHDSAYYEFPGDPNDTNSWSELSDPSLPAGDREYYGSIGPMNFLAGETKHFDFAFTASYDSTATMYSIVDTLKRDADFVQAFYNNTVSPCRNNLDALLGINKIKGSEQLSVSVFPNPSDDIINVQAETPIHSLQLMDLAGRMVTQLTCNQALATLQVSALAKGVYLLRVVSEGKAAIMKIVIQ